MWDSTNGSRCYQWKLAERYRSVFHDHSNSQNVSYLGDRTCLCWVKINKIFGVLQWLKDKMRVQSGVRQIQKAFKGVYKGRFFYKFCVSSNRCSNESVRVLLYPESLRDPSCFKDGSESQGERLWPVPCDIKLVPEPKVELPERHPSEWRNHWALADSPMHEAQREVV